MSMLATAIDRLTEFRRSWNAGDVIDEDSRLTADDLDILLAELHQPERPIVMGARE